MHADIFKVYLKKKNYSRVIIFQQKNKQTTAAHPSVYPVLSIPLFLIRVMGIYPTTTISHHYSHISSGGCDSNSANSATYICSSISLGVYSGSSSYSHPSGLCVITVASTGDAG